MTNKEITKYFYEKITSDNCQSEVSKFVSETCTLKQADQSFHIGIEGMKQHIAALHKTYPDFKMKVINQICEDDCVVSEVIAEGTFTNDFLGIKATGKRISLYGVNVDKVVNAKIIEHSGGTNTFEVFYKENLIKPW